MQPKQPSLAPRSASQMSQEYMESAEAVRKVWGGRCGMKSAIYDCEGRVRNLKRVFALVCETLRHTAALERACGGIPALAAALRDAAVDRALLFVVAYEVLWGVGKVRGGGAVKRLVVENEAALRAATGAVTRGGRSAAAGAAGASASGAGAAAEVGGDQPQPPTRWVRVNTLAGSVEQAVAALCSAAQAPATGAALARDAITPSALLPYMLRLPQGAHAALDLHRHPAVLSGALVLQDLPSALPPHALLGEPGAARAALGEDLRGLVIDACAAPGNKTSQLAALLASARGEGSSGSGSGSGSSAPGAGAKGKKRRREPEAAAAAPAITAFDRDASRLALLQERLGTLGALGLVAPVCGDFLAVDPAAHASVTAILLDPSCSGSGMKVRWGGLEADVQQPPAPSASASASAASGAYAPPAVPQRDSTRVRNLAAFQLKALTHALSFPGVRRVVYSTCSLYAEENECVVAGALAASAAAGLAVQLMPCLAAWPMRGVAGAGAAGQGLSAEQAQRCVRWDPTAAGKGAGGAGSAGVELGDVGFFVALFEKRHGESAQ